MADQMNLRRWTKGEEHWLRRRAWAKTQAEQARYFDISETRYNRVERDLETMNGSPALVGKPTMGNLCALARRRHGLGLRETAALLGISHTELLIRERESDPRLVKAWRALGYLL